MASRPHSVQDLVRTLKAGMPWPEPSDGGWHWRMPPVRSMEKARLALRELEGLEEQLQAAKREADMYRADRDEYDALLGRKMAERDGLREQLDAVSASNAAAATLAGEFSVRVKVLQEQLDATRVALDRGAADYVGLLEQFHTAQERLQQANETVALYQQRLAECKRERDEAVEDALRLGAFSGKDEAVAELERLKEQLESLREAVAEAMTSLATGPMKDGYAYSVLEEATADPNPASGPLISDAMRQDTKPPSVKVSNQDDAPASEPESA